MPALPGPLLDEKLRRVAALFVFHPHLVRTGEHLRDVEGRGAGAEGPPQKVHRERGVEVRVPGFGLGRGVDEDVPGEAVVDSVAAGRR